MKIGRWATALSLAAVLLAGCGGGGGQGSTGGSGQAHQPSQKLQSLDLTLEGYPNAENVGVLMANRQGYFADAGFKVDVHRPVDSNNVPGYVVTGGAEFALLPQPQVVMGRDKGMPLVAVGRLVGRPTMAMIWLRKSKIHDLGDLKGRTIAINGFPFEEAFLEAILARAGLTPGDVKVKNVSYGLVSALSQGRADAILGSGNVEGLKLQARGLEPVVTLLQRLGVPSCEELVMVTRRDRLAEDPRSIRGVMSAVGRGTAAAVENPDAAAAAIVAARKELELPPEKLKLAKAEVEAALPLLARTARMSRGRATRLAEWMREQGLVQHKLPAATLLTNRYVQPRS